MIRDHVVTNLGGHRGVGLIGGGTENVKFGDSCSYVCCWAVMVMSIHEQRDIPDIPTK